MTDQADVMVDEQWTVGTLRKHFEALLDAGARLTNQRFADQDKAVQAALVAQEKAVAAALAAADRAVIKAETAAEKRADANNEFRGQLADQAATLMPRTESEQRMAALGEKSEQITANLAKDIAAITSRLDRIEGKSSGLNAGWAILIAMVAAIGTVVGVIYIIVHK